MSDIIRAILAQSQGQDQGVQLDRPQAEDLGGGSEAEAMTLQEEIQRAIEAGLITPEQLQEAGLLPGGSMAQDMGNRQGGLQMGGSLQDNFASGRPPMSPMISSVPQLDRP